MVSRKTDLEVLMLLTDELLLLKKMNVSNKTTIKRILQYLNLTVLKPHVAYKLDYGHCW